MTTVVDDPEVQAQSARSPAVVMQPRKRELFGLALRDRLSLLTENTCCGESGRAEIKKKLVVVFVLLISCLAVVNVVSYFVIDSIFGQQWHLSLKKDQSPEGVSAQGRGLYNSIARQTIPFVQDWYRERADPLLPPTEESSRLVLANSQISVAANNNTCVERWFSELGSFAAVVTPNETKQVLASMGLLDVPVVVRMLKPLLSEGSHTDSHLSKSSMCLGESRTISSVACETLEQLPGGLQDWMQDEDHKRFAKQTIAHAVVVETLTTALLDNFVAMQDVVERMEGSQRDLYDKWTNFWYSEPGTRSFFSSKYSGMVVALREHVQSLATNKHPAGLSVSSQLQMNILEAVKVDIERGYHDNAKIGIALAASLSRGHALVEPSYEGNRMAWPLGKEWVEAYIAWNLAFVAGFGDDALFFFRAYILMLPSVACEMSSAHASHFLTHRLVSLALFLMGRNENSLGRMVTLLPNGKDRRTCDSLNEFATSFGKRNLNELKLSSPSIHTVESMFNRLCGQGAVCLGSLRASESSPTYRMDEEQYRVFAGFVLFVTMMLSGIGWEYFTLWGFLNGLNCWSRRNELRWRSAQFAFSLLALISMGLAFARNFLSLFTTVVCLWKFGFPETVSYVYTGLFVEEIGRFRRSAELLNGLGTVIHHGAASIAIAMLLTGLLEPARHNSDPIFLLAMQHWFVILRYIFPRAYLATVVLLEAWFEWSIFASLESIYFDHWTGAVGAVTMLFAHWLFVLAGALELLVAFSSSGGTKRHEGSKGPLHGAGLDHSTSESSEDEMAQYKESLSEVPPVSAGKTIQRFPSAERSASFETKTTIPSTEASAHIFTPSTTDESNDSDDGLWSFLHINC